MKCTDSLNDTNYQKLTQEEIQNLNSPLSKKEIEFKFNNFHKETSGPDDFIGEFHSTFNKEIIPVLHLYFQKIEEEI